MHNHFNRFSFLALAESGDKADVLTRTKERARAGHHAPKILRPERMA